MTTPHRKSYHLRPRDVDRAAGRSFGWTRHYRSDRLPQWRYDQESWREESRWVMMWVVLALTAAVIGFALFCPELWTVSPEPIITDHYLGKFHTNP